MLPNEVASLKMFASVLYIIICETHLFTLFDSPIWKNFKNPGVGEQKTCKRSQLFEQLANQDKTGSCLPSGLNMGSYKGQAFTGPHGRRIGGCCCKHSSENHPPSENSH